MTPPEQETVEALVETIGAALYFHEPAQRNALIALTALAERARKAEARIAVLEREETFAIIRGGTIGMCPVCRWWGRERLGQKCPECGDWEHPGFVFIERVIPPTMSADYYERKLIENREPQAADVTRERR